MVNFIKSGRTHICETAESQPHRGQHNDLAEEMEVTFLSLLSGRTAYVEVVAKYDLAAAHIVLLAQQRPCQERFCRKQNPITDGSSWQVFHLTSWEGSIAMPRISLQY